MSPGLFAQECMRLADETKSLKRTATLVGMAQEWVRLAVEKTAKPRARAETEKA
jgi:hypothetical protein